MDGDSTIRELAAVHGQDNISDEGLRVVKTRIAEGCIDDMLDNPQSEAPANNGSEETNGKA